jgi:hypothetical protein
LGYTRLVWNDRELLWRLIEERYAASQTEDVVPHELWSRFFCATVDGVPAREFLADHCLPRPRDFIYFIKAALEVAITRGHARVEADDIQEGYKRYSEFAFEVLGIEDSMGLTDLAETLLQFVGCGRILDDDAVKRRLRAGRVPDSALDPFIEFLCVFSFLGLEVGSDRFRYVGSDQELKKVAVLAREHASAAGRTSRRYEIHPAYRAYLEVVEP